MTTRRSSAALVAELELLEMRLRRASTGETLRLILGQLNDLHIKVMDTRTTSYVKARYLFIRASTLCKACRLEKHSFLGPSAPVLRLSLRTYIEADNFMLQAGVEKSVPGADEYIRFRRSCAFEACVVESIMRKMGVLQGDCPVPDTNPLIDTDKLKVLNARRHGWELQSRI